MVAGKWFGRERVAVYRVLDGRASVSSVPLATWAGGVVYATSLDQTLLSECLWQINCKHELEHRSPCLVLGTV